MLIQQLKHINHIFKEGMVMTDKQFEKKMADCRSDMESDGIPMEMSFLMDVAESLYLDPDIKEYVDSVVDGDNYTKRLFIAESI